jgi:hypothetical protein
MVKPSEMPPTTIMGAKKLKRNSKSARIIKVAVLVSVIIASAANLLNDSISTVNVSAQLVPLPPAMPNLNSQDDLAENKDAIRTRQLPAGFQPPVIEILTKVLKEGKNVIRVNVSSEAEINYCIISFPRGDEKRIADCVQDKGSVYKGLIDANPPSQIVEVHAKDTYGDSAFGVERINVVPQGSVLNQVWNLVQGLYSTLRSSVP